MHGRKGSHHLKARKANLMGLYLRSVLFYARIGTQNRTSGELGAGYSNSSCLQVKSVTMHFYLCPAPVFFDLRNFNGLSAARSGAASGRNPIEPSAIPAAIRKSQDTQYDGGRGSLSDGRCGKGRSPARHSDAYFFGSTPNCFWKHLAK